MHNSWINWEGKQSEPSIARLFLASQLHAGGRDSRLRNRFMRSRISNLEMSTKREICSSHRSGCMITNLSLDSVESRFLLTGSADGGIACVDLQSIDQQNGGHAKIVRSTQGKSFISSLQWYPHDSGCFISSDYDGCVSIWDTNVFKKAYTFDLSTSNDYISSSSINNAIQQSSSMMNSRGYSGYSVGSSNYTGKNGIYANKNLAVKRKVVCAQMHSSETDRIIIACGLSDSTVKLCDTRTGDSCLTICGHTQSISCLQWNPVVSNQLTSASFDGTAKTWDIRRVGGVTISSTGAGIQCHEPILSLDWRGDHTTVASNAESIWNMPDEPATKRYKVDMNSEALSRAYDGSVMSLKYSNCGNYIVTSGTNTNNGGPTSNSSGSLHTIRLWNSSNGKLSSVNYDARHQIEKGTSNSRGNTSKVPYEMCVASFTCGGDELLLYPNGDSGDICIVPLHSSIGKPLKTLSGHVNSVNSIIYRGNEHDQIISAGKDGMIFLWESQSLNKGKEDSHKHALCEVNLNTSALIDIRNGVSATSSVSLNRLQTINSDYWSDND
jgi:WD40 repeat protein